jgi:hypothetical protein
MTQLSLVIWDVRPILIVPVYTKSPLDECAVKNKGGGSKKPKMRWKC